MKRCIYIVFLLLFIPSLSNADVIASWSGHSQWGVNYPSPNLPVMIRIADSDIRLPNGDLIWTNLFNLVLTVNDVGKTFVNSYGTEFDAAKTMLLDGTADLFGFYAMKSTGEWPGEIYRTGQLAGWQDSFNFTGYDIDKIEFKLNELRFWTAQNSWEPQPIDYFYIKYTVFIEGHSTAAVPEAATMLLLGLGLVGLAGVRRKFKK